jgi:hypothetical protein
VKAYNRFCWAVAIMLLTAVVALAGDFSGQWQGTLLVNGGEMPGYLVLKQDSKELSGTAGPSADHQINLKSGSVDGGQVTLEANPGDAILKFVLSLKDGKLSGDVFEDGKKIGTATFLRVKE